MGSGVRMAVLSERLIIPAHGVGFGYSTEVYTYGAPDVEALLYLAEQ